jgi:hypothetical protein
MFQKFTSSDKILMASAALSLIFAELSWFSGERESAIFVGLWVPSILGFGIYLKLINRS